MKIVIATPLFPPETGSSALYTKELAKRLKENHSVTILTYANHTEKIPGVKIKKVKKNTFLWIRLYSFTRTLIRLAEKADVIYTQRAVAAGLPAILASWLTKTPVVVNYMEDEAWERYLHNNSTPVHQGAFRKIQKIPGSVWSIWHVQHFVLKHAARILAPSEYISEELARTHKIPKDHFVSCHTMLPKRLHLPFKASKKPHRIFMYAPLYPWADIETALRALKLLQSKYKDVELIVAGDGPERLQLQETIQKLDLEKTVTLLGTASHAEELYNLKSSSVFLSTATYAEQPSILYNAFREGVPVVAPDVPGVREGIDHEVTGLLTQPANATIAAEMIEKVFEDTNLRTELIENAKDTYDTNLSWDKHIGTLIHTFNSCNHG